jgi:hypothetical protein
MKKRIFGGIAILIIAVVAAWNVNLNENNSIVMVLSDIESIASCEVSSNASNNGGYCISNYGNDGDSCVTNSSSGAVRCNGNL